MEKKKKNSNNNKINNELKLQNKPALCIKYQVLSYGMRIKAI
jgi:hypothetical protein